MTCDVTQAAARSPGARPPAARPADAKPADAAPAPRRRWDDVPLRHKLMLLVAVGGVWGVAIGQAVEHFSLPAWVGPLAAVAWAGVLVQLALRWIAEPVERFVVSVERSAKPDRPSSTAKLPRGRQDELGRIARAVHHIAVVAIRDHQEANRLRRTLDHRIEQATRRATAELSRMAMRDALTSLGNRRFLDEHLEELVNTCRASHTELVCVIIDLDNFKPVNDTLGHATGDELIAFAGSLIRSHVRDDDLAVRYGGDEFVVLMPGADTERATQMLDRIRSLFVEHTQRTLPDTVDPGLSAGIACLLADNMTDGEALIDHADHRLYEIKRNGKGRTGR